MAGQKTPKAPKVKDDKTKKRKRDVTESGSRTKRHRAEVKERKANGQDSRNGELLEVSKPARASAEQGASDERELEISRQFDDGEAGWKVSKPMGGRMLDIDPILTDDELYLILTYNTSIQVFSAADSLLVRRIPITTLDTSAPKGSKPANIVATRLAKKDSDFLWVACSDGRICYVNWVTGSESIESFQTASGTANALTIISDNASGNEEDIILVAESDKAQRMDLVAYQGALSSAAPKNMLTLKKPGQGLQLLESTEDGQIVVGALNDRLFLGVASNQHANDLEKLHYEFFSFDTPDLVTTIDVRAYARPYSGKKSTAASTRVVDVIVGSAHGAIYRYHDALSRLQATGKPDSERDNLQAQKYHWHRTAVHAVKWSRDGNYMISGGSENVLVIWQMDTSKKNFLPHLSGTIENIVVSARGSSYVVHMDDNSTMILSTAELKPTAYVSGIQSAVVSTSKPKDLLVQRVWTTPEQVSRLVPAAIRPTEPSKLHVCVGNGRQSTMSGDFSAPLLQSFDLETFTSASKQALARTQPTDVNTSNKGIPIDEPLVTHIAFSADGNWLASVDDWQPSARDVENVSPDLRDQFIQERHEVYLKFWEVRDGSDSVALVSRINAPHATSYPQAVLDLASDPVSSCFATIGGDGMVRLWRPKSRQQNGISSKGSNGRETVSWSCSQMVAVGDGLGQEASTDLVNVSAAPAPAQGSVTFSEDGSTVFAAFGAVDTGVVYVIDASSGEIVRTLESLWKGKLQSIRALSPYIVVLSDDLTVYDVVADELRYGIVVPKIPGVSDLLQLAVDHTSGHFAVTLPVGEFSSIGVFDPEEPEPLLVRSTPHRVVSLISAPDTSGFIAIDDAAQVWVIAEGSDPSSLSAAQPLQDLRLDGLSATIDDPRTIALAGEDAEMASDDENEDEEEVSEDVEMEDDDIYASVVPQQYLTDIFDATPAFAAPSIEDMFYKVTSLLATKPLSAPSA